MISVFVYIMKISKTKLWKNILKELQKTIYIFVFIDQSALEKLWFFNKKNSKKFVLQWLILFAHLCTCTLYILVHTLLLRTLVMINHLPLFLKVIIFLLENGKIALQRETIDQLRDHRRSYCYMGLRPRWVGCHI
jgi:hypothetical protein